MTRPQHRRAQSFLCVHQGFELYGSDRVFLQTLAVLRDGFPASRLTVLLPRDGPLAEHARQLADEVRILDLSILRRSEILQLRFGALRRLFQNVRRACELIEQHDLTYISTVSVLDFILAARGTSKPVVIHVHELVTGIERPLLSLLLAWSNATLVFVSGSSARSFWRLGSQRRRIVHNGVADPLDGREAAVHVRDGGGLRLLVIGRLSPRKGQLFLLDAIAALPALVQKQVELRIVGDVFGRDRGLPRAIIARLQSMGLDESVVLCPFTDDPGSHYAWSDIVIVPSVKPESFGLTAVEAMAHGKPVIAASTGGLEEIVQGGITGVLFPPRDVEALSRAITDYLHDRGRLEREGIAARERYRACFTASRFEEKLTKLMVEALLA